MFVLQRVPKKIFLGVGVLLFLCVCFVYMLWPPPVEKVVRDTGSDDAARAFRQEWLGRMLLDAREKFNPESIAQGFSRLVLDPSKLVLSEPTAVRIYFVASQGSYHNQLGYWLDGKESSKGRTIIFEDASSSRKLFEYADALGGDPHRPIDLGVRQPDRPVLPGDFVDFGILPAGTQIGFFLLADGAYQSPRGTYTTLPEQNRDGQEHVVAVAYHDSPYLLLAFEDQEGGGDRSFNDVVFAVELSKNTIEALGDARKQAEVEAMLRRRAQLRALRKRFVFGASVVLVVAAPFAAWITARAVRRRRITRKFSEALASLNANHPQESLRAVRQGLRMDVSGNMRKHWAEIEREACKQMQDAAHLQDLFDHFPGVVVADEAASLLVARAQLATNRTESMPTLLYAWQKGSAEPWKWALLESDLLIQQGKFAEAQAFLQRNAFQGPQDAGRAARLAELTLPRAPQESQKLIEQAVRQGADNPDVFISRAHILEQTRHYGQAEAAYRTAIELAPENPFIQDNHAEFCIRRRNYGEALACWRNALTPPTADTIWLKALFWERVAGSAGIPWDTLEIPIGPLQGMLALLRVMPKDTFWTPQMEWHVKHHPGCLSRAVEASRDLLRCLSS